MPNVVQVRPLTAAILAALGDVDLAVGAGTQPAGTGWDGATGLASFAPYAVVHHLQGETDGPLNAPDDDADSTYQVTGVGATDEQAAWVGDLVRRTLTTPGVLDLDERAVSLVRVADVVGPTRDDDVEPVLWFTADRFTVTTTP